MDRLLKWSKVRVIDHLKYGRMWSFSMEASTRRYPITKHALPAFVKALEDKVPSWMAAVRALGACRDNPRLCR